MIFGAIPGLGGKIALISVMPFLIGMDTLAGCVFLISLHAVVHTGAAAPTLLLGIPGTGPSTAVVLDGHAMTKNGDGTRAITAAAIASGIGGVVGTICLALIVPFALNLMKQISYPEIFLLTLFGLGFCALLSGNGLAKGLIVGCLGLTIAFVGKETTYGVERLTFEQDVFYGGISLVTAVLSMFAIPEMLRVGRTAHASQSQPKSLPQSDVSGQIWLGVADIIQHRWLTLRTSVMGVIVGIIPGLGGDVAAWLCYGHAAQGSDHPEKFGKGAVEGVIGPEAANNSKEGGSLVPTLFLGIPGSSGMAIFLIALVPLGVSPGLSFVEQNNGLIWAMVWALALSNILAAVALVALSGVLQRLSRVPVHLLVPYVYLLAMASIYIASSDWRFFMVMVVMSAIGYAFLKLDWPRAPFVIGLILGPEAETSLVKSLSIWGPEFLLRPVSLLMIGTLLFSMRRMSRRLMARAKTAKDQLDET
jgi:TctA family transporter